MSQNEMIKKLADSLSKEQLAKTIESLEHQLKILKEMQEEK